MREFHIGKNDENQRLDRFLGKAIPLLPASLAQKYIRLKRIKVNGARAQRDQKLVAGDILQCYITDEFFESPSEENVYLTITTPRLKIVYEDENIMLLDKPAGMLAHADEHEKVNTLVNHMLAYLYQKREWRPREENAFTPALCNRIDRNTGGIVIAAKNAEALRILNDKIRDREIAKYYLCIALGRVEPPKGRIECFLRKDEKSNTVRVYHRPVAGRPQRDHLIPNAPDARRAVASGGRAAHGSYASDPREHGRPRPSPARRRQIRRRQREPQIWRNASGALLLPPVFRLPHRCGHPRISARMRVPGGRGPVSKEVLWLNPTSGEP